MRLECKYDEMMALAEVKKRWHPANENDHPESQIRSLSKVIAKIGIRHAIHISKQSGKICGGHGRYLAFEMLGYDEVPIIWENFKDELEELNYRASDNIGQYAEFNYEEYARNLEDAGLDLQEIDLEEYGVIDFELPEIETLNSQTDEDEVPEVEHPITRRGDIWLLGNHRLMCGDSTMIGDVEKLMNGEKADMVFTDPPYGVNYQSNMRVKSEKFNVLKNDDEFLDIVPIIEMFSRGFVFIWSTWKVVGEWLDKTSSLGKPSNMIAWFKGGGGIGDLKKTFSTDWELALVWHRGHELCGKRIGSVWQIGKDKAIEYKHPTQKPVQLAEEALDKCSKDQYKVLDLFGGSGSTLIACEKMNRRSLNMELDEKYCDVIINRWQNYTGKKATLEATGQTYEELKGERDGKTA